ncbi:MAG: S24 family peptidase [Polaromonas sp.]|uniref:LexA family protein n=1 Tax=Polaromonas sp. TaxID=1869339 RepID=UPI002487F2D1|nr:S24 family peptidase [Polaromonas sp.]MDI1238991.1 S24 family peptidase [Polaromonas sp.]MDI1340794.1 S24 family peptidase [Polaromonas sp.]
MSVHTLIREGRKRLGMSEQQFADAAGVSRGAVQQWERPGGTAPKRSNQRRVAELLGVSVAELISGGSNVSPGFDVRAEVPLISEVQAGNYTVIDNFNPGDGLEMVPVTVAIKRHTFALRVQGDSMVGTNLDSFPEGSLLIVEPEMQAVPGDYVIALNSDNETTFKQLIRDGGELFLKPLNVRYPIRPLGSAEIIGVVREFTKKFR